jgi:hypothetical protein
VSAQQELVQQEPEREQQGPEVPEAQRVPAQPELARQVRAQPELALEVPVRVWEPQAQRSARAPAD